MIYKIVIDKKAEKDFVKLDNAVRRRVIKFLEKLEKVDNPRVFGEELTGNLVGCWKYRVGDYRIGVEIQDNKLIILIIAIGHRNKVYDKMADRVNK